MGMVVAASGGSSVTGDGHGGGSKWTI
jgi:hypothetical protein